MTLETRTRPQTRRANTPIDTPTVRPKTTGVPSDIIPPRGRDTLGIVFQALLGIAACLALVAVVQRADTRDPGSVDAPPPAVFVQTD